MQCEMCGENNATVEAVIENTKMNVCRECSGFGKVINELAANPKKKEEKAKPAAARPKEPEVVEAVMPDFGQKIRKAREKLGLSQKDFAVKLSEKESVVHKLETGSMHLSIASAKKIERILNIKLIAEYKEEEKPYVHAESPEMTLGDLFKKK